MENAYKTFGAAAEHAALKVLIEFYIWFFLALLFVDLQTAVWIINYFEFGF